MTLVQLRDDFAAAHRLCAHLGLNEGAWTHFSVAVPGTPGHLLMTPGDMHFSQIDAEDILHLDERGHKIGGTGQPNQSAWAIHEPLHRRCPQAVCILHAHAPYSTALTMIEDGELDERASQNAALFFERVAYHRQYDGVVQDPREGEALADSLQQRDVLFMDNHGVIVTGPDVGTTFVSLYILERACMTQILAMQSGRRLKHMSVEAARHAADPANFEHGAFAGLKALVAGRLAAAVPRACAA